MGKIVRFNPKSNENNNSNKAENVKKEETQINSNKDKLSENGLKNAIENYIKSVFAVKDIIEMVYIEKTNKSDVGFLGRLAYEHKRRAGIFVADFIGHAVKEKNGNYRIMEIAFEAGEPHLYNQIKNILKAKNILPVIK